MSGGVWDVRDVADGVTLKLRLGETPVLVLVEGDNAIRFDLVQVRLLVEALADGATDLAVAVLNGEGGYHA